MKKIINADKDLERLVDKDMQQFQADLLSLLDEHGNPKFPGFLTLAQAVSIVVAKYSADINAAGPSPDTVQGGGDEPRHKTS